MEKNVPTTQDSMEGCSFPLPLNCLKEDFLAQKQLSITSKNKFSKGSFLLKHN